MASCVLCFNTLRLNKNAKLDDKVAKNLTLSDAIKEQLQCSNVSDILVTDNCTMQ